MTTGDDWPTTPEGMVEWLKVCIRANEAMRDATRESEGGDSPECQYFQGRLNGFEVALKRAEWMLRSTT